MEVPILAWVIVLSIILVMVFIDLLVFNKHAHEIRVREAAIWTGVWLTLGLGFGAYVYFHWGAMHAGQYLAGYLLEKSLAVDNLFVFAVVFAAFGIPLRHQHRVLFWGVMGALILRGGFIAGGVALLHRFHWAIYAFGALLLFTAWRTWVHRNRSLEESTPFLKSLRRRLPITHRIHGQHFFAREDGKLLATPLLAALVAVEIADVVFAIDSVPAVIAVTQEPFLVYTSNAFAILGLRAMYFFLAAMIRRFEYLSVGLVFILAYVGIKMLVVDLVDIPIWVSLAVIVVMLGVSVLASVRKVRREAQETAAKPAGLETKA
ncbi:MAG TPA: TerC/Alx family metal homeostasis membrane protein [Acidimicrobiia bacterium]|nr:TerC/Alx family metal homeostasis membrane protein [Acidimicrobiia bacterium]